MFEFIKEMKQAKLAKSHMKNYTSVLFSNSDHHNELQREFISNTLKDIEDSFTLLRTTYNLSKPINQNKDYRLLKLPSMRGVVFYCGKKGSNPPVELEIEDYYTNKIELAEKRGELVDYIVIKNMPSALWTMNNWYSYMANIYGVVEPFSKVNFITIRAVHAKLRQIKDKSTKLYCLPNTVSHKVCQQIAHTINTDILISI